MANNLFKNVPLTDGNEQAAPGTFGAAEPIALVPPSNNVAEDQSVRAQIDVLYDAMEWTRTSRSQLNNEWLSIYAMEMQMHDENRGYVGHSDAYLPLYTRILQTLVSNMATGLFPSGEYLDVTLESGDLDQAKAVKRYIQWEFERVARVKRVIKSFLRPYAGWGIGVLKYRYKRDVKYTNRPSRHKNSGSLADILRAAAGQTATSRMVDEGLHVSARNPLYWYVYPPTVDSIDDAQIVFETVDVPFSYVKKMVESGAWKNGGSALYSSGVSDDESSEQEMLSAYGLTAMSDNLSSDSEQGGRRKVTEAYCYLHLPKSEYLPGEPTDCAVPAHVILVDNVPVLVQRNPLYSQRPPYVVSVQNATPGNFYGYGAGRLVKALQHLSNDFTNQTNDAGMYGLNPVVLVNSAYFSGPVKKLRPGVTWSVTDVKEAVKFDRPPVELVQYGLQLANTYQQMAQEYGGAPPILQGVGSGRGAKTATGMQVLQRNAMTPLQDVISDLEEDVMVPLIRATWLLAQQYRGEGEMGTIAGAPVKLTREELDSNAEFRWLASNQAVNQSQRAQQATGFIQLLGPLLPILQQQGKTVDFERLLSRIWGDGFGFSDFSQIVKDMPQQPMGPPGMGPMGPQQPQAPEGDRVRSTTEQTPGGGEIAPGEGEDFMAVRAEADQLAAMMGGDSQGEYE